MSLNNEGGEHVPQHNPPGLTPGGPSMDDSSVDEIFGALGQDPASGEADPATGDAPQETATTTEEQPTGEEQPTKEAQPEGEEGGEEGAEAEIGADTKLKVVGADGNVVEVTGKELTELMQQNSIAESTTPGGALIKPEVITQDANEFAQQHGISAIEGEAKQLVADIDNNIAAYHKANQDLVALNNKIAEADAAGDSALSARLNAEYRTLAREIDGFAVTETKLKEQKLPDIQNRLNQAMGRVSVQLMQKHFPNVVKAGETIESVASRIQTNFGLSFEKALGAIRDPQVAAFACYALMGHATIQNGTKALSQAKQVPNKALVLNMGGNQAEKGGKSAMSDKSAARLQRAEKLGEEGNLDGMLDELASAFGGR